MDIEDFPDDILARRDYEEFVLDRIDENNLKDIESSFSKGLIGRSNKDILLDYLQRLHNRIDEIKKAESPIEGNINLNVNGYLKRIGDLIDKISQV